MGPEGWFRRRILQALSVLPLWLAAGRARVEAAARSPAPGALGYLPWWMAVGWEATPWDKLDRLVLFDAPIKADGRLLDRAWAKRASGLIARAAQRGIPVDVALTLFEHGDFDQVFGDAASRRRLLASALRLLEQDFVAGLHLDIEGFAAAQSGALAGFRDWLSALDERRRRAGKGLSAFFPASDNFAPYDAASAQRIDYWVVQVYDAHARDSNVTGPLVTRVADNPVAVQRALQRLAGLRVSPGAVLLSVPLFGWEWPSASESPGAAARGPASLLTYADTPQFLMPNDRRVATELARRHGLRRDREHTPYYAYHDGAHWVQGWFEDRASLTRKLAPERGQGYAGLAFFALGYDKNELVDTMLRWWRSTER